MKTILKQTIDGHEIITNVLDAGGLIDPVATQKIVNIKMKDTDTYKAIEDVKKQIQTYVYQASQAKNNSKMAKTPNEKKKHWEDFKLRCGQIKELEEQLKPLAVEIQQLNKEMIIEHAVYFTPGPGEEIIDDNKADEITALMVDATANNQLIKSDLTVVDDYRGKTYWKKLTDGWKKQEILKLGDVPKSGYIEDKNLTVEQKSEISEQLEKERIAALSSMEKEAEKLIVIAELKMQAVTMRSSLEIDGDPDALEKAREWLNEEVAKVEIKYA